MKLFVDQKGEVDFDQITDKTTVQDLLDAIDLFLLDHPLPCDACEHSCCKNPWLVEVDNVSANRLCQRSSQPINEFVQEKLVKKKNHAWGIDQFVMKKETECIFITDSNRCTVYEQRPIICRLYICSPKSYRYNLLREMIACTFLRAFVLEDKMKEKKYSPRTIRRYKNNPAVFASDYNILLADILKYSQVEGWFIPEDGDFCQN